MWKKYEKRGTENDGYKEVTEMENATAHPIFSIFLQVDFELLMWKK